MPDGAFDGIGYNVEPTDNKLLPCVLDNAWRASIRASAQGALVVS